LKLSGERGERSKLESGDWGLLEIRAESRVEDRESGEPRKSRGRIGWVEWKELQMRDRAVGCMDRAKGAERAVGLGRRERKGTAILL